MIFKVIVTCILINILHIWNVNAHGKLMDPVGRSSAWRKGFNVTKNFSDNELFCGGFAVQYEKNKGNCGPCGDDWSKPRPRDNENGGTYGKGVIVSRYRRGQPFEITVNLNANHLGYFEFSLCPLNSSKDIETEECFDAHPIYLADGNRRYEVKENVRDDIKIRAVLPKNFKCPHCVLRWHYYCGNNWGFCNDGSNQLSCGNQEVFRSCADITIR